MTASDDLVTDALKLGAAAWEAWFGMFKGLAIATAEVVNPDDVVEADNAVVVEIDPPQPAGPVFVGWLTPDKAGLGGPCTAPAPGTVDVLAPSDLTISPAGLADLAPGDKGPQVVKVWVTHPESLPAGVTNGTKFGAVYRADDPKTPIGQVIVSVAKEDPTMYGGKNQTGNQ